MLKLIKGCHNRTGLTKTVLVISISICINSSLQYRFYRNTAGTSRTCLVYPEYLVNRGTTFCIGEICFPHSGGFREVHTHHYFYS